MMIDNLIKYAVEKSGAKKVKDIRAGLGYTCVLLDDGACGLAYTFRNDLGCCCGTIKESGSMIGMDAVEVMSWANSDNLLKAAMGIATINAVINDSNANWDTGNVLNEMRLGASDTFGMIGEFKPILNRTKDQTKETFVFTQNVTKRKGFYASEEIPEYLPKCDVVFITATSLINHTIDDILLHCKNAHEVCVVGPSTPMCAKLFEQYPVTLLAGSVVANPELLLQIISQGGGTMSMKPAIKQVLLRLK